MRMHWNIVALAESRSAKYDVLLKHFVQLEDSELRRLLGIMHASSLPTEFANLHAQRADGLFELADGRLVHVEFQTRWEGDMAWRMLDYRLRIAETHHRGRHKDDIAIHQIVLYIGNAALSGAATLSSRDAKGRKALEFRFDAIDIRRWNEEVPTLARSMLPDDWILGLLCLRNPNDHDWLRTAERIRALRPTDGQKCAEACAKLLVAATLRKVPPATIEALKKMAVSLDVEDSQIWREVYDKGQRSERLDALQDLIEARGLEVSGWAAEQILELSTDDLLTLRKFVKDGDDVIAGLSRMGYRPPSGMSLTKR